MDFPRRSPASLRALMLAFVVVVAFGVPAHAAAPVNLLKNPGFEAGLEGHPWMPAGWDTSAAELPTVFFGRDTFLSHNGTYAVSIANLSAQFVMAHNWSQTLLVGPELWGKDLVFSAWTRSNGVQGRAYILLQAYRDTVSKMAKILGVDRDEVLHRMRITKLDDPSLDLGWDRETFEDEETPWVRREVHVYCPPSTNVLFVRMGLLGTGQVLFDEASLTAEPARPAPLATGVNLLRDPGFEEGGRGWEFFIPPYEGMFIGPDSVVVHSGRRAARMEGGLGGMVQTRVGACQVVCNRNLGGKRVRFSAWVKTDSLIGQAYIKMYAHTLNGLYIGPVPKQYSLTTDWTLASNEFDVPPATMELWVWCAYNGPVDGRVYYDDASLEVLGPSPKQPAARPGKSTKKPAG